MKRWKSVVPIVLLFLILLSACGNGERTKAFEVADFEMDDDQTEVSVHVGSDVFKQDEVVGYTISNLSTEKVYYPALGPVCDWPATVLYTFVHSGTEWERIAVEALDFTVVEEGPYVEELAAGETVACSWVQTAWQAVELEGASRFTRKEPGLNGDLAPVPSGRYQFGFHYSYDPDVISQALPHDIVYSRVFQIE